MNRSVILTIWSVMMCFAASAQDIITKTDGTELEALVVEVSTDEVRFRKISNQEGPLYVLPLGEIFMIKYANGEKDVFGIKENSNRMYPPYAAPRLKYRDLRITYDYHGYEQMPQDRYSCAWIGVASAFVPGLGQAICNEWGRACGIAGGMLALRILGESFDNVCYDYEYGTSRTAGSMGTLICFAAAAGLEIWNIVDAIRVARVKNMYFRDYGLTSVNVSFGPSLAFQQTGGRQAGPSLGVSLKLQF